jgi:hypothetical protein
VAGSHLAGHRERGDATVRRWSTGP